MVDVVGAESQNVLNEQLSTSEHSVILVESGMNLPFVSSLNKR